MITFWSFSGLGGQGGGSLVEVDEVVLRRNEEVFPGLPGGEGEGEGHVWVVREGRLRMQCMTRDGDVRRRVVVAMLGQGDVVGAEFTFLRPFWEALRRAVGVDSDAATLARVPAGAFIARLKRAPLDTAYRWHRRVALSWARLPTAELNGI